MAGVIRKIPIPPGALTHSLVTAISNKTSIWIPVRNNRITVFRVVGSVTLEDDVKTINRHLYSSKVAKAGNSRRLRASAHLPATYHAVRPSLI